MSKGRLLWEFQTINNLLTIARCFFADKSNTIIYFVIDKVNDNVRLVRNEYMSKFNKKQVIELAVFVQMLY